MEQIDRLLQESKQQLQQNPRWQNSLQQTNQSNELINFCTKYSPSYQMDICGNENECFFGDYPSLARMRRNYGSNAAIFYLIPQLRDLAVYCGCKEKLDENQYKQCAFVISTEYHYLKISEIMLFCHRFKAGRYGHFYGNVDPLVITTALREFLDERGKAYQQHDREEEERREAEETRKSPPITYEEYLRRKNSNNEENKTIEDGENDKTIKGT